MTLDQNAPLRSVLFVPGSRPSAIAKLPGLACDAAIIDLEDAVADDAKDPARAAACAQAVAGVRVNGAGTPWHAADLAAVAASTVPFVVLPKVEDAGLPARVADQVGRPVLAMIETPAGVLAAAGVAGACAGLIAGTNDLAAQLRLPSGAGRAGLQLCLQTIVLAARAAGIVALDGVWNRLDDPHGLAAECAEGRTLGFDGKTLIHPSHIAAANAAFGPGDAELEEARALIAAATGGAERFRDRMIETMHVDAARRMLRLAGQG